MAEVPKSKRKRRTLTSILRHYKQNPELLREALQSEDGYELGKALRALDLDTRLLRRLLKRNPQLGYIMNPAQVRFHLNHTRGRACFWPNQVGKTVGLVNEAYACSQGERLWLPADHPDRKVRWKVVDERTQDVYWHTMPTPNVGRLFVNDFKAWDRDVQQEWEMWVPAHAYKFERNTQRNVTKIKLNNGSVIHVMTYEQAPQAVEGGKLHWAGFNEPCPKQHWTGTLRGLLSTAGLWWMSMTLLDEEPWIFDEIWEQGQDDPNLAVIEATIIDNFREYGGVLASYSVDDYAKRLDEAERGARIEGRPKFAAGKVFKAFKKTPPWIARTLDIDQDWPRFGAIDPHDRKPIGVLWGAVHVQSETLAIYDELYDSQLRTVGQVADEIKSRDKDRPGPWYWWMDPSGTRLDRTSGATIQQEFFQHGIYADTWSRADKATRIVRTRSWFELREEANRPRIIIHEDCTRLIWELGRYIYEPKTGKPVKEDDDLIDCLMALVNADVISLAKSMWRPPRDQIKPLTSDIRFGSGDQPRVAEPLRREFDPYEITGY